MKYVKITSVLPSEYDEQYFGVNHFEQKSCFLKINFLLTIFVIKADHFSSNAVQLFHNIVNIQALQLQLVSYLTVKQKLNDLDPKLGPIAYYEVQDISLLTLDFLSFDAGLRLCFLGGGGVISSHTIFICESNRKSNQITHCVDIFLRSSFNDMGFFAIDR